MFWSFGGSYLLGLQSLFCISFAWARWHDPGLASGSGFWIAGIGTLVVGLLGLAFETIGLFWSHDRKPVFHILRGILLLGVGAVAVWGLGPFGQAAVMRLAMTGTL